jgi:DNA-directed RNA polymerase subunit K/omega
MIRTRPSHIGAFEFVVIASLRAEQLMRGCTPKIPTSHKHTVTAQREVAQGKVTGERDALPAPPAGA